VGQGGLVGVWHHLFLPRIKSRSGQFAGDDPCEQRGERERVSSRLIRIRLADPLKLLDSKTSSNTLVADGE
jgi:hypothetical protein